MVKRRVATLIASIVAMILFSDASHATEIIYDSPEDLKTTTPEPATPIATTPQAESPAPPQAPAPQPAMTAEQAKKHFADLKKEIDSGDANMDKYFEYAQIATAIGENKEAIRAYNHMLGTDPSLDRIKLELGLLYVRMGKLKQSKGLFEEVLAKNPPEEVKSNIGKVMEVVNKGLRPDVISGSVSVGYNIDTNANSASSSGHTTFVDTSIPLSAGSTASRDGHVYSSASLTHVHKFDIDNDLYKLSYETTGTFYKTHQDTETALDLALASIKTGPVIELPTLKTKLGINGTESLINLNNHKYMKTRSWQTDITYSVMDNLMLTGAYIYEYRKFMNTGTATSYTDRSGNANQQNVGLTYALTPLDIFNTTVSWRYENAESQIYGNTQTSITGSYTRVLPWDFTFNTLFGYKKTNYHEPDPLVSAATLRHDRERSMTYTLAKRLPYNITATTAYQYKNSESNLQNYKYSDHRYSASLGWGF